MFKTGVTKEHTVLLYNLILSGYIGGPKLPSRQVPPSCWSLVAGTPSLPPTPRDKLLQPQLQTNLDTMGNFTRLTSRAPLCHSALPVNYSTWSQLAIADSGT